MDERRFDMGNNAKIRMAVKNWVGSLSGALLTELILSPKHIASAADNILSDLSISSAHRQWEPRWIGGFSGARAAAFSLTSHCASDDH